MIILCNHETRSITISCGSFYPCLLNVSVLANNLQFGFKKGMSTSLCTGFVKCVVTQYLSNESPLNLSKAFSLLFRRLLDRSLPLPIAHLLMTWYCDQNMRVRWNQTLSDSFSVTNGVRQGIVLSPILFTVYIDEL